MERRVQPSIGFQPSEISALVNRRVVDVHADEAAFLWKQRSRAVKAPHFQLKHLARLDDRLEGHLEGLQVAGEFGWAAAQAELADCDAGAVFVACHVAFMSRDPAKMRSALQLGVSMPEFESALVAALAWIHSRHDLHAVLERLSRSPEPSHRRVALSVWAACRADVGMLVAEALGSQETPLRARALRAIGELKRRDQTVAARRAGADANAVCRFWAGHSLTLLGDPEGVRLAFDAAREAPHLLSRAVELGMRCGDAAWARGTVRTLAGEEATLRLAIQAAGALGDPASVPWLLSHMSDMAMARAAGEAFSMITGADLDYLDLKQDAPDEPPEEEDMEDADLPWPHPEKIAHWWSAHRGRWMLGERHLAGLPISASAALEVLRSGYQRQRLGAALELARLSESAMVFPVAARANWQRQRLAA